jgi:endonuclease/exonuclease/phosphatase family metal-dependent hydrolase
MRVVVILGASLAAFLLCATLALVWASRGRLPDDGEIRSLPRDATVRPGPPDALMVATWNIGFGGGPDGMPTDRHDAALVSARLDRMVAVLRAGDPDVVFLQEVDRPSDRSGGIDQFARLAEGVGLPHACFVTTWNLNWLPFPPWPPSRHLGRIHSGQAILSRYPIRDCARIGLPQPDAYPWWYRRFFLHRALQVATIDLGGRSLTAVNVHLEAFSQPNREDQAVRAGRLVRAIDGPLVVAGDFNAPPPHATRKAGFADEDIDFSTDATLSRFLEGNDLRECLDDPDAARLESDTFTFPARAPTRRLDYVFFRGFQAIGAAGVDPVAPASDHLPVWATLRF